MKCIWNVNRIVLGLVLLPVYGMTQSTWSDVFKASKNQVIQIITHSSSPHWFELYRQGQEFVSSGSGSLVKINGQLRILTNFHVVEGAELILIQHPALGKEQFEVEFSGGCPELDCALLSFNDDEHDRIKGLLDVSDLPYFEFSNSDDLSEGQETMVIGYPLGQENVKNATGIISGRESTLAGEWITTTVPVNPGNSGGPFVNKEGKIIGICVARAGGDAQGIAYLIPINNACVMFDQFVEGKVVRTPFWGIDLIPMTKATIDYLKIPAAGGGYITEVLKESLGEKAGLKKGDILIAVNEHHVDRFCQVTVPWTEYRISFLDLLMRTRSGDDVTFTVLRDGQSMQFSVPVSYGRPFSIKRHFPPFEQMPDYEVFGGMVITQTTMNHILMLIQGVIDPFIFKYLSPENCYEPCIKITHILPGSELDKVNVVGNVSNRFISKVNGHDVKTVEDFRRAILNHATDEYVVIECQGGAMFALRLDDILKKEKIFARQKGYELSEFYYELVKLRKNK